MKKIMIALLAIAVLFGFAACDNSNSGSPSANDQMVIALEVTKGTSQYFAGDKLADDYEVTATRNNGSTFVVESRYLEFKAATGQDIEKLTVTGASSKEAKEKVIATVSYTGPFAVDGVTAEIKATVYKIDGINVNAPEEMGQYFDSQAITDLRRNDYSVTAYALTDPSNDTISSTPIFSKTYTGNDYGVSFNPNDMSLGVHTITFDVHSNNTPIKGGVATADINVSKDKVVSISIARNDKEAVVGAAAGDASQYVTVTYSFESGVTNTTAGTAKVEWVNGDFAKADDATKSEKKFVENETQPIKASISGTNITAATNVNVTPVTDYIKTFSFVTNSTTTSGELNSAKYKVTDNVLSIINTETSLDADTLAKAMRIYMASDPSTAVVPDVDDVTKNFTMLVNGTAVESFDISEYKNDAKLPVTFSITGIDGIDTAKTKCAITSVVKVASLS